MSVARYDLGLTEEEFWELTPAQYDALNERHLIHRQMDDYRAGVIASILCNIHKEKGSKPAEPADFFSSLPRSKPREMSPSEMLSYLKQRTAMLPTKPDGRSADGSL